MSWKPQVQVSGEWYSNALVFATEEEAHDNAFDLMMRWFAVQDSRAIESTDPVNYRYVDHQLVAIEPGSQLRDHVSGGDEEGRLL